MQAEFWLEKWEKGETGFHLDVAHPLLERNWPRLRLAPGSAVFVPLCGKSQDLGYLNRLGHPVTGIELSPLAIEQFFAERQLTPTATEVGGMPAFGVDGLRLIVGDFFRLKPGDLGLIAAVYDRASLIAMPPAMQDDYARQLRDLIPLVAPILLITLDYDPTEMQGPPFATPPSRIRELYADRYDIHLLEELDALDDNPALRNRGLTWLQETAWHLVPR